jgi:hypothetical protein
MQYLNKYRALRHGDRRREDAPPRRRSIMAGSG